MRKTYCFVQVASEPFGETMYLPGNLPFFKIHVNQFLAWDDSPAAHVISMHVVGEGPGAIL